ncbi:sensor histidine kinase [Piscinibacter gummiphilus]|uniref:histidine kinase n=1 Tax=Piscinibacter gummiphilus TaxID=946333 RepID=A0ABZ0CUD4_9BURK|nr:ATP-binding protein [Piscinibacter gummiphilus]WOB08585.1 ATP-binding protein [Piscinibacter gummiphilus]
MSRPFFLWMPDALRRVAPAVGVWALAWAAMAALDGQVALSGLAMLLVLASALATLWLPIGASLLATAAAVTAFNWCFVPPRHTFAIDLRQDALLLAGMLAVSWVVAAVVARQRQVAAQSRAHALQAEQLRQLGDALRDADDPAAQAGTLRDALTQLLGTPPALLVLRGALPAQDDVQATLVLGEPDAHVLSGLWHCTRQAQAFGPGTGRHADLPEWYLPLRGRQAAFGAVRIGFEALAPPDEPLRVQAQALCDQMGLALQRAQARREATEAQRHAQLQGVRNAMLAAISHDYRTPLAAIMGAASSLHEQGARLSAAQRERLAQSIVDETAQLSRLTDNTLQLARLDTPGVPLQLDWESAEEIVGNVLRRARRHDPTRRARARLEPGLPLVRCDAILLTQLLDNLVDNALKYSPAEAPVEVLVRRQGAHVVFAVRDRGPGIAPGWRERVFEVFQRGEFAPHGGQRRGAGVGLAVCRAIARAHGGELKLRPRGHGGTSFECWLPEGTPPSIAEAPA